jgi:hypothetical protein
MTVGNGIAIAGIWIGVGLVGFSGAGDGGIIIFVAGCAMFATLFAKV